VFLRQQRDFQLQSKKKGGGGQRVLPVRSHSGSRSFLQTRVESKQRRRRDDDDDDDQREAAKLWKFSRFWSRAVNRWNFCKMSGASRTQDFFQNGTSSQYEWVLSHYDEALKMKAESKSSKPENVIKLDKWWVQFFAILARSTRYTLPGSSGLIASYGVPKQQPRCSGDSQRRLEFISVF